MPERFIGCSIKQLPPHQHIEAARTAIFLNPGNAIARGPALAAFAPLPPERIAALTKRHWPTSGVNLTVSFLDNPDRATRDKILLHANAWGKTANVVFRETAGQGQVRIARAADGYWSYLGTDILGVPANEPTMNLQQFSARDTPDSEFYRVVRHEFGHTLGWPHEHLRKEIIARLDPAKVIRYFREHDGWDEQTTRAQVLTPLADADLTALPIDQRSIMAYSLPAEITIDGQEIPGGTDIDEEDAQLAAQLYPKETGPVTPPPPPPGPAPVAGKLFTLDFTQHPKSAGQKVTFYTPVNIPAVRCDVLPQSARAADLVVPESEEG